MSNSIWRTPDQKPEKENHIVLVGAWATCLWYGGEKPEEIFWENVKRWAYLEAIIAQADKAERLQKGIDLLFRQASVWSWQTAPTPDKKIILSRRQILGWLKKLKEIVKGGG